MPLSPQGAPQPSGVRHAKSAICDTALTVPNLFIFCIHRRLLDVTCPSKYPVGPYNDCNNGTGWCCDGRIAHGDSCGICCPYNSPGPLRNACSDGKLHCLSPGHRAQVDFMNKCGYQCPEVTTGSLEVCGHKGQIFCCHGTLWWDSSNSCNHCCDSGHIWCKVDGHPGKCYSGDGTKTQPPCLLSLPYVMTFLHIILSVFMISLPCRVPRT